MASPPVRIGLGHDSHRLGPDRRLILGGVEVPFDRGLIGHSDADVLLHAVTDGLLGALALGDIGEWFPNTDPQWEGADSAVFVTEAAKAVRDRGWEIANLDCTIFAELPKLSPFKEQIASNVASLLAVDRDVVSIKAKTGEKVGPIGRGESISAEAAVLLYRTDSLHSS
ncbi:MAG: 2-C-methyl-D-erythritol 2,4-cyclodiphosphate synthase [Planctomycetota bacterium]|nr:2-C-methyl-D-erythritol 2,4-cyclodiphosphate synthase [Planctomycetota bacterium]MDA1250447.1 2-C-methyl-D-erythritol 2,4-cyclodiphosphate synthase [Planctomycetota bacterium]